MLQNWDSALQLEMKEFDKNWHAYQHLGRWLLITQSRGQSGTRSIARLADQRSLIEMNIYNFRKWPAVRTHYQEI